MNIYIYIDEDVGSICMCVYMWVYVDVLADGLVLCRGGGRGKELGDKKKQSCQRGWR